MVHETIYRSRLSDETVGCTAKDAPSSASVQYPRRDSLDIGDRLVDLDYCLSSSGDDTKTIKGSRRSSLDEEIQSTLDDLQCNSRCLKASLSRNDERESERSQPSSSSSSSEITTSVGAILIIEGQASSTTSQRSSPDASDCISAKTSTSAQSNLKPAQESQQQHDQLRQSTSPFGSPVRRLNIIDSCTTATSSSVDSQEPSFSSSQHHSHCLKDQQHDRNPAAFMQGWRDPQYTAPTADDDIDVVFPRVPSKDGHVSNTLSSSASLAKVPRPKSWVSNIFNVASSSSMSRLGGASARQRHQSMGEDKESTVPVSALILQKELDARSDTMSSHSPNSAADLGQIFGFKKSEINWSTSLRTPRPSVGALAAAARSSPNLSTSSYNPSSDRKLLIRNLDEEPRGTYTPQLPPQSATNTLVTKKMTNPWGKGVKDGGCGKSLEGRNDLIDADEEEAMMDEALRRERSSGAMKSEELAVLEMLEQMNESVDTFEKPTVSRTHSRAALSMPKSSSSNHSCKQDNHLLQLPESPNRLSVKAAANALNQIDRQSPFSSPTREKPSLQLGSRTSSQSPSRSGSQAVMKAVRERDQLDEASKPARAGSPLRMAPSPSESFAGVGTYMARGASQHDMHSTQRGSKSPERHPFPRNDSTSSYASQTNAFLNRRPTHTADSRLTYSPNQSSIMSSSTTSFWGRQRNGVLDSPSTEATTPGLTSSDVGSPFKTHQTQPQLKRRLLVDQVRDMPATQVEEKTMVQDAGKAAITEDVSTPTPAAPLELAPTNLMSQGVSCEKIADMCYSPSKATTPLQIPGTFPCFSPDVSSTRQTSEEKEPDGRQSPSKLSSPKRAKDLIRLYEDHSAPSSPQLPSNRTTPTAGLMLRYKKAFASSASDGATADASGATDTRMTQPTAPRQTVEEVKSTPIALERSKTRTSRVLKGIEVDLRAQSEAKTTLDPKLSELTFSREEENTSTLMTSPIRKGALRKSARRASPSFIAKVMKPSIGVEAAMFMLPVSVDDDTRKRDSSQTNASTKEHMPKSTSASARRETEVKRSESISERRDFPNPFPEPASRANSTRQSAGAGGLKKSVSQRHKLHYDAESSLQSPSIQPDPSAARSGSVYYYNVHIASPTWQRAQAVLLTDSVVLSWVPPGGGRVSVVLDLSACQDVHSLSGPDHPSCHDDEDARKARELGLSRLCPMQLNFDDGVERLALDSPRERMKWVDAMSNALSTKRGGQHISREIADASCQTSTDEAAQKQQSGDVSKPLERAPPVPPKKQSTFADHSPEATDADDFAPPSPPSEAMFGWPSIGDQELLPADSASQRPARTMTSASRYTAIGIGHAGPALDGAKKQRRDRTPAQIIRDSVVSGVDANAHETAQHRGTVEKEMASLQKRRSKGDESRRRSITASSSPVKTDSGSMTLETSSSSSSQDIARLLQYLERQHQERDQREAHLEAQFSSFQEALKGLQQKSHQATPRTSSIRDFRSASSLPSISQAIQTNSVEKSAIRNEELAAVLEAIKENERAREAQQQQQAEIARYLNELNKWLEKDVVERSNEWKTLAVGVTQLHQELNQLKAGQAVRALNAVAKPDALLPALAATSIQGEDGGAGTILAYADGAMPAASLAGGPSGPRGMARPDSIRPPAVATLNDAMLVDDAAALGMNAPAPIAIPGPSPGMKRSGTRTWRSEAAPGAMRNNDVWSGGSVVKEKRKSHDEKKAEGRARRRSAFTDSSVGRIALAAGGAALLRAAAHEYDKYKERQRIAGRPEEGSQEVDEKTGRFVHRSVVPAGHADKIKEAFDDGNEGKIREAIKGAAEAGAGSAAIHKLMEWIRGEGDEEGERERGESASVRKARSTKGSIGSSHDSAASRTLRDVVDEISINSNAGGGGGAALALAVEEILKHLLEKKEEEKKSAQREAEAEAAREEKRREEEALREIKMAEMREREKKELVETILAKLQQEKLLQEQEAVQRQQEMDPKTAIESLVAAINQQRSTEAAQHASTDAAIKQMATELVKTSSEQGGKLVEAVHGAAKEMLRLNIDTHAEDLKSTLSREVSTMFEDVGKIREAKRALEQEIADLFFIKSKHLANIGAGPTPPHSSAASEVVAASAAPIAASFVTTSPERGATKSKPLPQPQCQTQATLPWIPTSLQPSHHSGAMPPTTSVRVSPHDINIVNQSIAVPQSMSRAQSKRDLIGPFSINFGPRKK